jgi:hypothetical protein
VGILWLAICKVCGEAFHFRNIAMTAFSYFVFFLLLGFALSYCFSVLFRQVTDPADAWDFDIPADAHRIMVIGLLLFAGPFILTQETMKAQIRGEWPDAYVAGGFLLSGCWSTVLGFAIGQFLIG